MGVSDDDNILFEYDDDVDNDESEISFVSEDENDGNNLEPPNKKLKSTYNGNGVDDDSVVAGFNGTIYRPWTFEEFIEQRFLNPLKKLEKVHLNGCTEDDLLIMLQYKK